MISGTSGPVRQEPFGVRRLAAAFAPIYHPKIVSRADEACAYSSSPGVWSLISAVVQPRHRARSRRYASHYKVMLNWIAVVGVAQLVERRSVAPNVAGSNPVSHPKTISSQSSAITSQPELVSLCNYFPQKMQLTS